MILTRLPGEARWWLACRSGLPQRRGQRVAAHRPSRQLIGRDLAAGADGASFRVGPERPGHSQGHVRQRGPGAGRAAPLQSCQHSRHTPLPTQALGNVRDHYVLAHRRWSALVRQVLGRPWAVSANRPRPRCTARGGPRPDTTQGATRDGGRPRTATSRPCTAQGIDGQYCTGIVNARRCSAPLLAQTRVVCHSGCVRSAPCSCSR